MTATRTTARAAARKSAKTETAPAANLPAVLTDTLAAPATPAAPSIAILTDDIDARLRDATGRAIRGMDGARSDIANLVAVIREAEVSGRTADAIGRQMQLGALMCKLGYDLARATDELDADERSEEVKHVLHNLKTSKSRAYSVKKKEDEKAAAGDDTPTSVRAATAPAASGTAANFMGKLLIKEPVNAADFHSMVLKARTVLKTLVEHGEKTDGCEADVGKLMQALACLPLK